jgi:hypothetical protein
VEVALAVLAVTAVVAALWTVPIGRWALLHQGHVVVVRNYAWHERVWVDGTKRLGTRTGGDRMTFAEHAVDLPRGGRLRIRILIDGIRQACVIDDGLRIVYDSRATTALPPPPPPPADPRIAPARAHLATLASTDPEAAAILDSALRIVVAAERRAARTGRVPPETAAAVTEVLACVARVAEGDPGRDSALDGARRAAERILGDRRPAIARWLGGPSP